MDQRNTPVLIIRAWVELHPLLPLRVNIRSTTDAGSGFGAPENFADIDAVTEAVRSWLADVEASGRAARA